jgi:exonuclease SbcC
LKLISVSLRNFRAHANTDVVFPQGVVGILGANESGKSTVLEAIVWALFGGDTTRGTKAGLRWHGAPARNTASVTLRFEIGGVTYRVDRGESSAKVFNEATGSCEADGIAPVNGYIPKLLGLTHAEFASSFMVKQKDVAKIAQMQPTERQAFIRSVMGMGRIDEALKACRVQKSKLAQEREGLILGLGERGPLDEDVEAAAARLLTAHSLREEWTTVAIDAAAVHLAAKTALSESTTQRLDFEKWTRVREQATTAREAAVLEVDRLKAKASEIDLARVRVEKDGAAVDRLPELRSERDLLVMARSTASERAMLEASVLEMEAEISVLEEMVQDSERQAALYDPQEEEDAKARHTVALADFNGLRDDRLSARAAQLAEATQHEKEADRHRRRAAAIVGAGADGDCPTCARRLGDAFHAVVTVLEEAEGKELGLAELCRRAAAKLEMPSEQEVAAESEFAEAGAEVERMATLREDARRCAVNAGKYRSDERNTHTKVARAKERLAALPAAEFDAGRLAQVEKAIVELEDMDRALATDRALVAQSGETATLLAQRTAMLAQADFTLEVAGSQLANSLFDMASHVEKEAKEAAARAAAENGRVGQARAEEAEKGAALAAERARAALASYDARAVRLHEVSEEHQTHEYAAARLAEFRVAVAATIRPEMEELMSGFVHLLTDGRHEAVSLDEEFNATLYESGVPVEVVSGGTEDIAALAMRLALSQMIAERAGHPLSLLILDEPFGSLDETRRGNVLALIRRLSGVFTQVVVISHVAETRDAVDHVVEFEFDEAAGCTRLVSAPLLMEVA